MKITLVTMLAAAISANALLADEANETKAHNAIVKAIDLEKSKQYLKSAEAYLAGNLYTDDRVLKMNTLYAAARTYRRAKLYGREFDTLQRLLNEHSGDADYKKIAERQFVIGEYFFNGHRDAIVSWLPFIQDADRTKEIYTAALKTAPLSQSAADAGVRLGTIYLEEQNPREAEKLYKNVIELHPETDAARIAYIELANLYYTLAKFGDGDGSNGRRSAELLDEFIEKYPDDPETPWAEKARQELDVFAVKRLYNIAKFYHRKGNDEAAKRYLGRAVRDYGTLPEAAESEKLLAQIDAGYKAPSEDAPRRVENKEF